jgi:L-ascorbate metabolism protein UlaG (beta-lactamase superfamily)
MNMSITWLGHSTVLLAVDGARILTDPVLGRRVGPLRRIGPEPAPAVWQAPDVVLMSHLHHDHADLPSLRRLGPEPPVLTSGANAAWLVRRGLSGVAAAETGWTDVGTVGVSLVRADHNSRPMPHRPNVAHGHVVRAGSGVVWFAGDTSLYDEMERIPSVAEGPVDVAVVPIGGWGARLSKGHLGPREAARACALVGARYAVPVHWGTLFVPGTSKVPRGWMTKPGPAFVRALEELAPTCRPLLLELGGTAVVPAA